jgi:hypothetical protein
VRRYETKGRTVALNGRAIGILTVHLVRNSNGLWERLRFAGFDFEMKYSADVAGYGATGISQVKSKHATHKRDIAP